MHFTIFEYIILGIIQGITEWLPASSSGSLTLIMANFLDVNDIEIVLKSILFLHLGTFFAVLIYFRKDVWELTKAIFKYEDAHPETRKILKFLIISTIISGIIGLVIFVLIDSFETSFVLTGKTITFGIGFLLLITGVLQIKVKNIGIKQPAHLKTNDGIILGIAQGISSLPGLSRSGITISTLLLKKFDDTTALRLSFLMSLPIVLIGNIVLNIKEFTLSNAALYGILAAFVSGILFVHILMKISKKINFGYFVLLFAVLMMLGALVI